MKTKEEIMAMTKEELLKYKWYNELDRAGNRDCFDGADCINCFDCFGCRNATNLKYAICNVQFTKEEYETKMAEINKQ